MKLKWINRNIEKEILIDNPIESNFNEDLDSATVLLISQDEPLEMEILDEVVLLNDDNSVFKYFCIGDYDEKMVNPKDPHYDYTISLVSQTKELEGIVLPNLSITKTDKSRSVWYYINTYLSLYAPKIRRNGPSKSLPIDYQEVEYIESSGIQYIDTKFVPDQNTELRVSYQTLETEPSIDKGIAGTRESSSLRGYGFGLKTTGRVLVQYGTQSYDDLREVLVRKLLNLKKSELFINDVYLHNFNNEVFTGYGSIYLCAFNEPNIHPSSIRLYYCEIYQNNVMVRNFIPCYRVADGAIGVYDTIDRLFYENIGSGEFIKGPDVLGSIGINLESKWTVNPIVEERFKNIRCPEIQWNRPTLREVINDLMMVDNCIPILNNNEISLFDLSGRLNTELDDEHILSIHRNKSIEDYTTEVEMELQNVIQDSEDGVYNLTNIVEYTGFRSEDEYVLTDENAKIFTKNTIYDIKHLYLCVSLKIFYVLPVPRYQYDYVEIDMCDIEGLNFVREYKEYITLPLAYKIDDVQPDTPEEEKFDPDVASLAGMNKYQNFNLYYTRGGKDITGFFKETKKFWFWNKTFLELILEKVANRLKTQEFDIWSTYSHIGGTGVDIKDISFKIEYQTLANTKFKAGKYLPYENERVIVDNQTNSYVNASKQGILEYLKANRLGNEVLLINSRYDSLSDVNLVEVGSTYKDDYVIFKRQIQVNPNYVNVNYYATKHYILRDYFTGVKAKIRSWKIESEESLVRNELHKYYYEFSFANRAVDDSEYLPIPENMMLSSFMTHYDDEIMKWGFIQSMIGYGERWYTAQGKPYEMLLPEEDFLLKPIQYKYMITELNNKVMGNTIVFDTQMRDNWSTGIRVRGVKLINLTAQTVEEDVRYTDSYGELRKIYFDMTSEININKSDSNLWTFPIKEKNTGLWFDKSSIIDYEGEELVKLFMQKPLATEHIFIENPETFKETYDIYKDQREITALSLQLEYCAQNENIVFGNQLVKDNNLVSTNYRTKYQEMEYNIVGTLVDYTIYEIVDGQPSNVYPPSREGLIAIGDNGNYYVSTLQSAYGNLYDLDVTRDVATVMAMGSSLANKYIIGITYEYTYPSPITPASNYMHLASSSVFDENMELPSYSASGHNGEYVVSWNYTNLRILSTLSVDYRYYEGVAVGESTGEATSQNNTYKVVRKLIDATVGELVDTYIYYSGTSLQSDYPANRNTGKFAAVSEFSQTRLYVSDGTNWVWAEDSNGKKIFLSNYSTSTSVSYAGTSYTFRYNGKNYYSNGNSPTISWREIAASYELNLLKSNGSYWILNTRNYTYDSTNVYFYNDSTGYRQWKNSAWDTNVSGAKTYTLYLSDGSSWNSSGSISSGSYGFVGTTENNTSTEWYSFNGSSWSFMGYTTATASSYNLYSYISGSVVSLPVSTLTDYVFKYDGNNYRWNMTDTTTRAGTWKLNNVFTWVYGGSAENKYFDYDGKTYLYTGSQLLYQQDRIPIRKINREDLRLFSSNTEKVRIYDMNFLPDENNRDEIISWSYSIGSNYIDIQGLTSKKSYYITDSNLNVLLAFNAPEGTVGGIRIYLNGYISRNKKIYN